MFIGHTVLAKAVLYTCNYFSQLQLFSGQQTPVLTHQVMNEQDK